ncbi:UDP-N-acetylmuramate dehydrogenase [Limnochorda pilosa]|uniref:UDP-N-acetylenolpyruvoylglucosamine reductase n=1 Tax=Limnochorda pilosa TaxID=1555112 RepID=A0A0K2SKT8_LIMPI|nr:UDP-N-acetylmuramate dehydrogenase [Limnochorda pilosa]BAS27705.1 UDP-N-acetylenolpyruvoylglucosamine reductase [Limnochorda pilosa]
MSRERGEAAGSWQAALEDLAEQAGPSGARARPLAPYTSFHIGGPADLLVEPDTPDLLQSLLRAAAAAGVPCTVMGGGTNLLVSDDGVPGIVVRIARPLGRIAFHGALVRVEAGASLPGLAGRCARLGLSGLEFAGGIPGTVGGAVVMNAGAHESNIGQTLRWVDAFSLAGEPRRFDVTELGLGYRRSRFQHEPWVVAGAMLELQPDDPEAIRTRMQAYVERRRRTQPLGTHNAGSIFKNPPGEYAGRLLEAVGAKGWEEGQAQVSTLHANFIVNRGGARAADVLRLIERMRDAVEERFGVRLELEVRLVGWPAPEGVSSGVGLPDRGRTPS